MKWFSKRGGWDKLCPGVDAIDGTSSEMLLPMDKPQEQFYSSTLSTHKLL
jgi:hypothetical protein